MRCEVPETEHVCFFRRQAAPRDDAAKQSSSTADATNGEGTNEIPADEATADTGERTLSPAAAAELTSGANGTQEVRDTDAGAQSASETSAAEESSSDGEDQDRKVFILFEDFHAFFQYSQIVKLCFVAACRHLVTFISHRYWYFTF